MAYKHYVRIDNQGLVVRGFSDAFEQPQETDILINKNAQRHFNIELFENEFPIYKYVNGEMVARTNDEIKTSNAYKSNKIREFKQQAENILSKTDFKILRHKEQIDSGIETSLSAEEYLQLMNDRKAIRDKSNYLETQLLSATNAQEVDVVVW